MNGFREVTILTENDSPEKSHETDRPVVPENQNMDKCPFSDFSEIFDAAFNQFGFSSEVTGTEASEANDATDGGGYSKYLEQGEDGKYYDKETGKAYDSIEAWEKAQETLAKRYEGAAAYFEKEANKEWARFKNSEENGESDAEKWEHYRKSQEYYAKAKECKEKAQAIRERLDSCRPSESQGTSEIGKRDVSCLVDAVPPERKESVRELFDSAPDQVKAVVSEYGKNLVVENEYTGVSNYNRLDKVIRMEIDIDNDEYAEVLSHEFGHFVDNQMGDVSQQNEFKDAVQKDAAMYDRMSEEGKAAFEDMLDNLMDTDAAFDRMVSDNLSAIFGNDPEIITRYWSEGASFYGHPDGYWARSGSKECELFANCFSMLAQNNSESCEFMEKYFPNTWEQFLNLI